MGTWPGYAEDVDAADDAEDGDSGEDGEGGVFPLSCPSVSVVVGDISIGFGLLFDFDLARSEIGGASRRRVCAEVLDVSGVTLWGDGGDGNDGIARVVVLGDSAVDCVVDNMVIGDGTAGTVSTVAEDDADDVDGVCW